MINFEIIQKFTN